MTARRPSIAVIGSGRAARAILGAARRAAIRRAPVERADVVIVAVADRAIESVAARLAAGSWSGRVALHLSGVKGPEALAALARRGAVVGALHPLTVFRAAKPVAPRAFRLDGAPPFRRAARRLAASLWPEARELRASRRLDDRGRARYHAAAALVANDLLALIEGGARLFASVGIAPRASVRALAALAEDALAAAASSGLGRGLTGPVVRGDVETVRRHLAALREVDPGIAEVHRSLSRRLVRIAVEAGRLRPAQAAALRRLVGGPRTPRGV